MENEKTKEIRLYTELPAVDPDGEWDLSVAAKLVRAYGLTLELIGGTVGSGPNEGMLKAYLRGSKEDVRRMLKDSDWADEDIDDAFSSAE